MKLKKLLTGQQAAGRKRLIGREIEILEERVLLLGLMEAEETDEAGTETVTKLLMLYEEKALWDEEDDEEDWDDETWEDEKTNRQMLIEWMEETADLAVTDIDAFIINGVCYEADEVSDVSMDERPYEEVLMLQELAEKEAIPGYWMEMDLDLLGLAEYEVDAAMWDVSWDADILSVSAEMIRPEEEVLVGKILECKIGCYEVPMEFDIKGRSGEDIPVKIHGVYLDNIWEDAQCLNFDFSELEEICRRDERLLVLDYSTEEPDLELKFYTKEHLDGKAYDGEVNEILDIPVAATDGDCAVGIGIIGSDSNGVLGSSVGRCVLDVVSDEFDLDTVEVELLSYSILED